jgi:hypothetical protein
MKDHRGAAGYIGLASIILILRSDSNIKTKKKTTEAPNTFPDIGGKIYSLTD